MVVYEPSTPMYASGFATRRPPQDHGKRPEATGSFQSQPGTTKCRQKATGRLSGGHPNSNITREVLRKGKPPQEAPGATRRLPEDHPNVTFRPPGTPRGPQRPPEAIPTRISRERCHEKKVMAIPALFSGTGKLDVPLQKQASFGPGWAYRCSKNAGFEKWPSPDP